MQPAHGRRRDFYDNWQELGLASQPDTGSNVIHGSASPVEAQLLNLEKSTKKLAILHTRTLQMPVFKHSAVTIWSLHRDRENLGGDWLECTILTQAMWERLNWMGPSHKLEDDPMAQSLCRHSGKTMEASFANLRMVCVARADHDYDRSCNDGATTL
eukprot:1685077-Amphidinium_carterae.1